MTAVVRDTVEQSMTSAKPLLYPIAVMNTEPLLQSIFVDPEKGCAVAGFRREVANFGVLLAVLEYGKNNEFKVKEGDYWRTPGLINYGRQEQFIETNDGLPGSDVANNEREAVNAEVALEKIDDVRQEVEGNYEVGLNPGAVFAFMQKALRSSKDDLRDRKVNMQFTAGVPQGYLIATAERLDDGEMVMVTQVPTLTGPQAVTMFIHQNSKIHSTKLHPSVYYMIKPVGVDQKAGRRYVDVLRPYHEGVRIAMQHFKMGIIKPGDSGYDVNPDKNNGLTPKHITDLPYLEGQKRSRIQGAPMMTVDLDMFYSLMNALKGYPVVVMQFKNSTSGIYFRAEGDEYRPNFEAIMGPTIQHVRGRIWLP